MSDDPNNLTELQVFTDISNDHLHVVQVLDEVDVGLAMADTEPLESTGLETEGKSDVQEAVFQISAQDFYFQTRLQQLNVYKDMHGDCNVPIDYALQPG
jgi:hypothetical protein